MEQNNQSVLGHQCALTEQLFADALAMLEGLGYTATESDRSVLRFCVHLAQTAADRFTGRVVGAEAADILVRMTLGEFFFFLDGAGRSFQANGAAENIRQLREGDIAVTYDNRQPISSSLLIDVLRGAVRELAAERRLTW